MTTDRDQSIERLLRRAGASGQRTPDHCPDAEMLAAFADETLAAVAKRDVEAHVADCHRCQALTAAIARAETSAETAAFMAAGGVPWWKRRALNWLVPVAAATTAVALWVIVPGQRTPLPEVGPSESQRAAASPSSDVAGRQRASVGALRDDQASGRVGATAAERVAPAAPPVAAPADASLKAEEFRMPERIGEPSTATSPPSRDASANRRSFGRGGQAPAQGSRESSVVDRLEASGQAAPSDAARRENAASEQEQGLAGSDRPAASAAAALSVVARAAAGFDVVSPNPPIRWRVGPGPIVQYSTDGGATWVVQQTGAPAALTAGSAPAVDVCWLVGRGGIVVRTTDGGRQWQRVAFPETVDLTAVTASTPLIATVTLADGRRFGTTDGGRTWVPAP